MPSKKSPATPTASGSGSRSCSKHRLAGKNEAVVWPATSQDLPDKEPQFLIGYMPLEFAGKTAVAEGRGREGDARRSTATSPGSIATASRWLSPTRNPWSPCGGRCAT